MPIRDCFCAPFLKNSWGVFSIACTYPPDGQAYNPPEHAPPERPVGLAFGTGRKLGANPRSYP